eukprot:scaffold163307_cov22-Prasinocladus_malaysianus.AAC.1
MAHCTSAWCRQCCEAESHNAMFACFRHIYCYGPLETQRFQHRSLHAFEYINSDELAASEKSS